MSMLIDRYCLDLIFWGSSWLKQYEYKVSKALCHLAYIDCSLHIWYMCTAFNNEFCNYSCAKYYNRSKWTRRFKILHTHYISVLCIDVWPLTLCRLNDHKNRILLILVYSSRSVQTVEWISMCLMNIYLHGTIFGLYTYLGNVTLEKGNMILTFSELAIVRQYHEHVWNAKWHLWLAMMAIVIMDTQEKVINTCLWIEFKWFLN